MAELLKGDAIATLASLLARGTTWDYCLTSPPYYAQVDYQQPGQYGLEDSLDAYLDIQQEVFRLVYQGLPVGGVAWIVLGDTSNNYSPIRAKGQRRKPGAWAHRRSLEQGYREKEPLLVAYRLAERLRADGWLLRKILIWDKGQGGQVSKGDAPGETHEYILMLGKWPRPGRPYFNTTPLKGTVLNYRPSSSPDHPCPYPLGLATELLSSCSTWNATVLDPFVGTGTTAQACRTLGLNCLGIDLNPYPLLEETTHEHSPGDPINPGRLANPWGRPAHTGRPAAATGCLGSP